MPTLYFRHTSKSRFKCFNTFINVFLLILIQLFNNGLFRDRLSFGLRIHFASGLPRSQNLLNLNLDYSVDSDGAIVIEVVCLSTFQG